MECASSVQICHFAINGEISNLPSHILWTWPLPFDLCCLFVPYPFFLSTCDIHFWISAEESVLRNDFIAWILNKATQICSRYMMLFLFSSVLLTVVIQRLLPHEQLGGLLCSRLATRANNLPTFTSVSFTCDSFFPEGISGNSDYVLNSSSKAQGFGKRCQFTIKDTSFLGLRSTCS